MATELTRQVAKAFIENLTEGNLDAALSNFSEGAVWHLLGKSEEFPLARQYEVSELDHLMTTLATSVTHDHYVSIDSIIADGDRAAIEIHPGGKTPSGGTYDNRVAFMLEIEDGKIVYLREYLDTHHLKGIIDGEILPNN